MHLCAILGDGLVAGVADNKVGNTSSAYVAGHLVAATATKALISLWVNGSNPTKATTADHLTPLRAVIQVDRVYWILLAGQMRPPLLPRRPGALEATRSSRSGASPGPMGCI